MIRISKHALERFYERCGKFIEVNKISKLFKQKEYNLIEYSIDGKMIVELESVVWLVEKSKKALIVVSCYGKYSSYIIKRPELLNDLDKYELLYKWENMQQRLNLKRVYG